MTKFELFIKERSYLLNVSASTILWYEQSLRWLGKENPTDEDLKDCVYRMKDAGLKAISCNNRIRAINAYLHWSSENRDVKCSPACKHLKVRRLKEEDRELPTFKKADILRLLAMRAKNFNEHRLQTLIAMLIDSGARRSEAFGLLWSDVDFDNLLLTLHGKGRKDRKVPMSLDLRRRLFAYQRRAGKNSGFVFATRNGTALSGRNVLRHLKSYCRRHGVNFPERTLHAMRHTFATQYLNRGGNVFMLQRQLGQTSLEMVRKYAHIATSDLSAAHEGLSILGSQRR